MRKERKRQEDDEDDDHGNGNGHERENTAEHSFRGKRQNGAAGLPPRKKEKDRKTLAKNDIGLGAWLQEERGRGGHSRVPDMGLGAWRQEERGGAFSGSRYGARGLGQEEEGKGRGF